MIWDEVKRNVVGCYDCEVQAAVIVEALCLSKSSSHFVSLIHGALGVTDQVQQIAFGSEDENS